MKLYHILISLTILMGLMACQTQTPEVAPNTPTTEPTIAPSATPTTEPTAIPTVAPTNTIEPETVEEQDEETADTTNETSSQLNIALGNLPDTLDPHRTANLFAGQILGQICETLVYVDIDLVQKPLLAEGWQFSEDSKTLTMTLRSNIVFQDKTPFNADAVIYTFDRLLAQPLSEGQRSTIHNDFKGVTVEKLDDYTIRFQFSEPRYGFLNTLSNNYAGILAPTTVEAEGIDFRPICTGAYQLKEWVADQYIVLERNMNFHLPEGVYANTYQNRGPAKIEQIRYLLITTHEARIQALLDGLLEMGHLNTSEDIEKTDAAGDFYSPEGIWLNGITYFGFNYQREPTNNLPLRQAMAHAIDKRAVIEKWLPDFAKPAIAPLPPNVFGYSTELAEFGYEYDVEKAQQLLDELGYLDTDGDGIREINGEPLILMLLTTTDNIYRDIASTIIEQLTEVGVGIELVQEPRKGISEITPTGEFDLLLYDYNWPYPDALNLFLHSSRVNGTNRAGYSNPTVDAWLDKTVPMAENDEKKKALLIKAQQQILQDVPWHPILARELVSTVNKRVKDLRVHPTEGLLFHDAYIE
ncbi:ABC transporter substrate-binding protein [Anaerolineales bacterium HSG24]|nr:ABC transporter substrate-binding protein [Anaerolineales bacterium HSG24]